MSDFKVIETTVVTRRQIQATKTVDGTRVYCAWSGGGEASVTFVGVEERTTIYGLSCVRELARLLSEFVATVDEARARKEQG